MTDVLQWERVVTNRDDIELIEGPWSEDFFRAKVPGGWLVRQSKVVRGGGYGGFTFYPDPEHNWIVRTGDEQKKLDKAKLKELNKKYKPLKERVKKDDYDHGYHPKKLDPIIDKLETSINKIKERWNLK